MRVVLLQDLKALGISGQAVDVPEGYAVNFLFPEHLAVPALHSEAEVSSSARPIDDRQQDIASAVDGLEVFVERKTKRGKFVEPITVQDIVKAVKQLGYRLQPEWIKADRIDEPGNEEVTVSFPGGYEALLSVVASPV